jgi:4-hydroxy-tetrahydrodipicolinate reductase
MAHLAICRELGVKLVIGTTGFSDAQKAEMPRQPRTSPSSWRPT